MMNMRNAALSLLLAIAVLAPPFACAAANGSIETAKQYPVVGTSTLIYVRDAYGRSVEGARVDITYRPESRVEKSVSPGATNSAGIVRWTPEEAGVVTITAAWTEQDSIAGSATINISVKFASTPASGVAIMIFAGLLLLGGSAVQFARLMRESDSA
jgi:hypothetical protein